MKCCPLQLQPDLITVRCLLQIFHGAEIDKCSMMSHNYMFKNIIIFKFLTLKYHTILQF